MENARMEEKVDEEEMKEESKRMEEKKRKGRLREERKKVIRRSLLTDEFKPLTANANCRTVEKKTGGAFQESRANFVFECL